MCDLKEQWGQDVEVYGDNAYLWWIGPYENPALNHFSNKEFEYLLNNNLSIKRKDSAMLPFDLDRTKAGDVVDVNVNNEIVKLVFAKETTKKLHFTEYGKPNIKISVRKNEADSMLRMATPPKVTL